MIKEIEATERVKLLREYYLNNAPLSSTAKNTDIPWTETRLFIT